MQPDSLLANMRFFALFAALAFNLLLIYLIVVRTEPVQRSSGVAAAPLRFRRHLSGRRHPAAEAAQTLSCPGRPSRPR